MKNLITITELKIRLQNVKCDNPDLTTGQYVNMEKVVNNKITELKQQLN